MESSSYDVFYVDKFNNQPNADSLRARIGRRFRLTAEALAKLSSGKPVVVKRAVDLAEARRYLTAFRSIGGVCWVQPHASDGQFRERRQYWRRSLLDRRALYRNSSAEPDRRQSCGRRSSDMWRPRVEEF